jgi:hypothetical protein
MPDKPGMCSAPPAHAGPELVNIEVSDPLVG